jgi:phosphate transport system permease protein
MNARIRTAIDGLATGLAVLSTVLVVAPLVAIFVYLIYKGASSLSLGFFTNVPKPEGEPGGGMANAILGSGVLLGLASAIGVPIGISLAASFWPSTGAEPSWPTPYASQRMCSTACRRL